MLPHLAGFKGLKQRVMEKDTQCPFLASARMHGHAYPPMHMCIHICILHRDTQKTTGGMSGAGNLADTRLFQTEYHSPGLGVFHSHACFEMDNKIK